MMTEQRLAEIEARAKQAAKGLWRIDTCSIPGERILVIGGATYVPGARQVQLRAQEASFIAAARTDVPDLVAEVRAWQNRMVDADASLERGSDALQASQEEVRRLRAALDTAFEDGLRAVTRIRCMAHRDVPAYNTNEATGAECPACEVEAQKAEVRRLREALRWALPWADNWLDEYGYDAKERLAMNKARAALAQEPLS